MVNRVTAQQVALLAGVSQSAVSRVYTPGSSVSAKTKDKVKNAASSLGYRPNVIARAMVSGKSRIIGLVVAYLDNYFYPTALEKLSNALQEKGYHVLVFMAAHMNKNIDTVMEEILSYQVDGIIIASASLSNDITLRCKSAGVPIVLFNRDQDFDHVSSVSSNNFAGGKSLANFLCHAGHQKIAYIAGWQKASTQRDRQRGFEFGLRENNQSIYAFDVGNFDAKESENAIMRMFDVTAEQRPDAVFLANDHMAITAMDILRFKLGLKIPEDVSVVGYDDVPPSSWASYNLTTIRQRTNMMVDKTIEIILQQIEKPEEFAPKKVVIDGPLIIRGSSKTPSTKVEQNNAGI